MPGGIPMQMSGIGPPSVPGMDMQMANSLAQMPGIGFQPQPIPGVIPDAQLRPALLTLEELQRELTARGIVYSDNDKVVNIGKLINYLVELNHV